MKISIKSILPIIILIHTIIWYLTFYFLKINDVFSIYTNFLDFIISNQGEYYSTLLMSMMAFNILLSCRLRILENLFSGLDKVYVVHKYTGYFILTLLILHNVLIKSTHDNSLAKEIANPIFYIFLFLIFISALPHIPYLNKVLNIPYHVWKWSHKLMGILFLFGIYHSLGVQSLTFNNHILSIYMYIVYIFGILGFLYSTIFYSFFTKIFKYKIKNVNYLNKDITEIYLENYFNKNQKEFDNNHLKWRAGQFAFYQFLEDGIKEIHPFTISNFNDEGILRLSIKSLGDWTESFKNKVKISDVVLIDGPYGYFNSQKEKENLEIWIAGGIGITPFLSMLQDYKIKNNKNKKIIFIWTVKNILEAVYKNEIEKDLPENIKFILHDTGKNDYFSFQNLEGEIKKNHDIKNISLYICGPILMRQSLIKEAKKLGIKNFYYEEFNFR